MKEFFFLRRPVLALVLSALIVLMGAMCLKSLPVAQYPDLVPPAVSVAAVFPGASPEVMAELVAAPLEQALNGVPDVWYMQSTSSASGVMNLTVTFRLGVVPEQAVNRVNIKVQGILASLPDEVRRMGVTVTGGSGAFLQIITLASPDDRYDSLFLNNYVTANIIGPLQRVPGVSVAAPLIAEDHAMRIWFDPARLAAARLTPQDIAAAVREQNAQYAAGTLGLEPAPVPAGMTWLTSTRGRLSTAEDFGDIILRVGEGKDIVRLRDVAEVTLGAADYGVRSRLNGKSVAGISISLSPGANALETANRMEQTMQALSRDFPPGMEYSIPYNVTTFVKLSIDEVIKTLAEAMLLVVLVIFLFLQNPRATLIPCLAVPIAIIGTFSGMWLLGFSINTLTLFGMVLSIGIVVDDAIVVLENAERIMHEEGISPREATTRAMREVTGPVIAIVLVLAAVFVPVSFMGGITGEMFRQFGITIALSVAISGAVALSLTPVMCAALLKPRHGSGTFFRSFERSFAGLTRGYLVLVGFLVRRPLFALLGLLLISALSAWMLGVIPQGLTPDEDQGYIIAAAMLPEGASMPRTDATLNTLSEAMLRDPAVDSVLTVAGQDLLGGGGALGNAGAAFIMLKPWKERKSPDSSSFAMVGKVFARGFGIADGMIIAVNPPPIVGMSTVGGLEGYLQNNSGASLREIAETGAKLGRAASARPELRGVRCDLSLSTPNIHVELDTTKAKLLGVSTAEIYQTLSAGLSGAYINDFVMNGRVFKVTMQADARFRALPDDLDGYFVRSREGEMIPLSNITRRVTGSGAVSLTRFNALPAARLSGQAAPGRSNLEAMNALEEIVTKELPPGYSLAWSGNSFQEKAGGGTNYSVLLLGLGLVFMILAAQYENLRLPVVAILAVPFAVFGAMLTILLAGYANDVYVQVALVTLVGLSVKNAILIVEFAWAELQKGKNATEAALAAASMRFRPIIMTSLAFILGCLPLVLSSGAGAASRHVLGGSIIGGMLAATAIAPVFIPAFFVLLLGKKAR